MFKDWRKKLDSSWIKKNRVWDIVIYGSYIRGNSKAKDIDLGVILSEETSLKKKWLISQELRNKLAVEGKRFDVKTVDFNDLLDPGFLGREAILAEGYSLITKDYLAKKFGFDAFTLIEYSLGNLTSSKKKLLYYALRGRKKGEGLLPKLQGRIISKGTLEVPTKNYEEIKSLLDNYALNYKSTFLLKYRVLH